ncbi:hypothetical protein DM860_008712 [Cuscuta australis]|uniref:SURP motif domain-containing protein n=1 Tax=Cuscuta australis TaxID=267555 RepID=A0A328D6G1_9ASTE|nr:hypothetical protein DM860_008712 [Cuscuta australis]
MPDHHLHPYYRYLVDHQELLDSDGDRKPQHEERKAVGEPDGALSLLGSVYGSGEDDDVLIEDVSNKMTSNEAVDAAPIALEKDESSESSAHELRQEIGLQHPLNFGGLDKEKSQLLKENPSISGSENGGTCHKKVKDDSISASIQAALEKLKASGLGVIIKNEPVVVEPPSDLKKLIGRIVEFILKNGKQFEATLVEQDSKHGRFPFLLPSNMYHPYYLKVLHDSQESKVSGKSFPSGRDDSIGRPQEKRASLSKGGNALACRSGDGDLPCENDKEKFKMVIGKSKKEPQEQLNKVPQQENGFNLDAASVAAILQAAARGIKNPNIGIFSKTDVNAKSNAEANSSESKLSKEQMLKAERRKKAKMFVAMLKNKAAPFKSEPSREVSLEPQDSGQLNDNKSDQDGRLKFIDEYNEKRSMRKYRSRSGIDEEDEDGVKRKHQSAGTDHKSLRSPMDDEKGEESEDAKDHNRSKRKKHHQSHQSNEDEASDVYEEERSRHRHSSKNHRSHNKHDDDDDDDDRHSRKKHRSHNRHDDDDNEDNYDDRHSRKKHRSHKEHDGGGDDDDDRHSRKKHRSHNKHDDEDDDDRHLRKKHRSHNKHDGDDGEGKYHRHSRKKHRSHHSSHHRSRHERSKRGSSIVEREDLEEGEISGGGKVSDQSKGSLGGGAITRSREASIDVSSPQQISASQPPDDLKAKIRAMLIETRR